MPDYDLVTFLRARLDEDEQAARACAGIDFASVEVTSNPGVHDLEAYVEGSLDQFDSLGELPMPYVQHIVLHDPARVLAEVDTKRRILALHHDDREHSCPTEDGGSEHFNHLKGWGDEVDYPQDCPTLRLLALPYADHPDFREQWRL